MVNVAVNIGVAQTLHARVREINGDEADEASEVFKPRLLKDHGGGLVKEDMEKLVDWINTSNKSALSGKDKIIKKLAELRHYRYATFHVNCPDGRVPPENSMFILTLKRC